MRYSIGNVWGAPGDTYGMDVPDENQQGTVSIEEANLTDGNFQLRYDFGDPTYAEVSAKQERAETTHSGKIIAKGGPRLAEQYNRYLPDKFY